MYVCRTCAFAYYAYTLDGNSETTLLPDWEAAALGVLSNLLIQDKKEEKRKEKKVTGGCGKLENISNSFLHKKSTRYDTMDKVFPIRSRIEKGRSSDLFVQVSPSLPPLRSFVMIFVRTSPSQPDQRRIREHQKGLITREILYIDGLMYVDGL